MEEGGAEVSYKPEQSFNNGVVHSPYYGVAVDRIVKQAPEMQSELERALGLIDGQALENFMQVSPKDFAGVNFPITRIDVNELYDKLSGKTSVSSGVETFQKRPRETYVIFGGGAIFPEGHPFTFQDITYDRAINALARIARPRNEGKVQPHIEIIAIGYPNAMWGKVSERWIRAIKDRGFEPYGEALAEYLKDKVFLSDQPTNQRVIFQTMSMGASVAEKTLQALSDDERKRVRVLHDNPAGLQGSVVKGLQIPAGFAAEGSARLALSGEERKMRGARKIFYERAKKILEGRGIIPNEESEQINLKKKAAFIDSFNIVKGTPHDTKDVRTFIRKGIADPTSFSPLEWLRTLAKRTRTQTPMFSEGGRVTRIPHRSTHFVDRYRVKKWARIMGMVKTPQKT